MFDDHMRNIVFCNNFFELFKIKRIGISQFSIFHLVENLVIRQGWVIIAYAKTGKVYFFRKILIEQSDTFLTTQFWRKYFVRYYAQYIYHSENYNSDKLILFC